MIYNDKNRKDRMTTMNSLSKEILEIATRIKELREICDVSEEELANEVGVSLEEL